MSAQSFIASVVENGIATAKECKELLSQRQGDAYEVLLYLSRTHPHRRDTLGRLWGSSIGVAYVNPIRTLIQYALIERVPEAFAREHKVLPLYELGGAVTFATPTPAARQVTAALENYFEGMASAVFAFADQIDAALEIAYQTPTGIEQLLGAQGGLLRGRLEALSEEEVRKLGASDAIVKFARGLILLALRQRASDVHIEPGPHTLRVRFRVDGLLHEAMKLELSLLAPIVARMKVMSQTDIAETRRAQDGRIVIDLPDHALDVRFSTVPTIYGEKVVLRLLGTTRFADVPNLADLDFCGPIRHEVERMLKMPDGIFFVTGPTGSGKTTTLSALLKHINNPSVNIVTVEDPVEYAVEGVNQIQLNEAAGMTFADTLRFLLRQDPDIMLIGEIRDSATAAIAARAALTGHLVLTTLHTNTALQSFTRMLDLGVDPTILAPTVIGALGQRLVRRVCDVCKERYEPDAAEMDRYFQWDGKTAVQVYRAHGCSACGNTGYFGRLAVHEIFMVDDHTRSLIARNAGHAAIEESAARQEAKPLRYDGLKKVLMGLTTFDEINRVAFDD